MQSIADAHTIENELRPGCLWGQCGHGLGTHTIIIYFKLVIFIAL